MVTKRTMLTRLRELPEDSRLWDAISAIVEEEKKQAQLQSELALLQQRAALERVVIDDSVVTAKVEQMRNDLGSFGPDSVRPLRKFLASFVDRIVVSERGGELYYHLPMLLPRSQATLLQECFPIVSVTFSLDPQRAES